jgi:CheY-like chemotaxis protein
VEKAAPLKALLQAVSHTKLVKSKSRMVYRDLCPAAGMDDYIAKPIDAAALAEVIEKYSGGFGRLTLSNRS